MSKADRILVILLRLFGISALFAIIAAIMPMSWMARIHAGLRLGEMPIAPVVEYLARSISAFYALFGALCLVLAADLERYRPLVCLVALGLLVMSLAFVAIDISASMPWWWTALEGPRGIIFGTWIFFLARRNP